MARAAVDKDSSGLSFCNFYLFHRLEKEVTSSVLLNGYMFNLDHPQLHEKI